MTFETLYFDRRRHDEGTSRALLASNLAESKSANCFFSCTRAFFALDWFCQANSCVTCRSRFAPLAKSRSMPELAMDLNKFPFDSKLTCTMLQSSTD